MKKATLLLLEDDLSLSETIEEYLSDEGYEVVCAYDGLEAEEKVYERSFDLLLLDVNVPGINGFELLQNARKEHVDVPAIFITSRNAIQDVESGYESGADDYLRKPFALKELLLRIQTLLKRRFSHHQAARIDLGNGMEYDMEHAGLYVNGSAVTMGEKEHRLLKLFLQRRNELIPHEVIYDHLWEFDEVPSETSLRTYIKNLRKLLGKERIVSHKRLGYQFS